MANDTLVATGSALAELAKLAQKAAAPQVFHDELDGKRSTVFLPDGTVREIQNSPRRRLSLLGTVASLIEFIKAADNGKHGAASVVVWLNRDAVRVQLDDGGVRGDTASLCLDKTEQAELLGLGTGDVDSVRDARTQSEFVRLLRIHLAGALDSERGILNLVRNLRFEGASSASANIQHAKESMGRSITAEVLGTDALPEEVTLHIRPWNVPDLRTNYLVRCALDVRPHEQTFRLIPYPGAEDAMYDAAMAELEAWIRAECPDVPLYRGVPG